MQKNSTGSSSTQTDNNPSKLNSDKPASKKSTLLAKAKFDVKRLEKSNKKQKIKNRSHSLCSKVSSDSSDSPDMEVEAGMEAPEHLMPHEKSVKQHPPIKFP